MKFIIHWKIKPEHRNEIFQRYKHKEYGQPSSVKLLGAWHNVNQGSGWAVVETTDMLALSKWLLTWTDLNENKVIPVIDDEDMHKILSS